MSLSSVRPDLYTHIHSFLPSFTTAIPTTIGGGVSAGSRHCVVNMPGEQCLSAVRSHHSHVFWFTHTSALHRLATDDVTVHLDPSLVAEKASLLNSALDNRITVRDTTQEPLIHPFGPLTAHSTRIDTQLARSRIRPFGSKPPVPWSACLHCAIVRQFILTFFRNTGLE